MATWAGGWDQQFGTPYALTGSRTKVRRDISIALNRRGGVLTKALMLALNGQAPGATASASVAQIQAVQGVSGMDLGGKRVVNSDQVINRATTSADKAIVDAIIDGVFRPVQQSGYPADKGGGGGGKLGTL